MSEEFKRQLHQRQAEAFWHFVLALVAQGRVGTSDSPYKEISYYFWNLLSSHYLITWEIIQANPQYPWNEHKVSCNPNVTWEIIQANPDYGWSWYYITINPNVTSKMIFDNPQYKWNWSQVFQRKDVTWEMIQTSPKFQNCVNGSLDAKEYFYSISQNPNITWEIVVNNLQYPWDWDMLSCLVPWEIIKNNPQYPWTVEVNLNPSITWQIVLENPDYPWDYKVLTKNVNITLDIIEANPEKDWDLRSLSYKKDLTWEFVEAHPNYPWSWPMLSVLGIATWDIMMLHPEKFKYFYVACRDLTYENVLSHPELHWNCDLACNRFDLENKLIEEKFTKEWDAVMTIKNWWFGLYWNPRTKVGRKVAERSWKEFDSICEEHNKRE